jgi:hypothetical protein
MIAVDKAGRSDTMRVLAIHGTAVSQGLGDEDRVVGRRIWLIPPHFQPNRLSGLLRQKEQLNVIGSTIPRRFHSATAGLIGAAILTTGCVAAIILFHESGHEQLGTMATKSFGSSERGPGKQTKPPGNAIDEDEAILAAKTRLRKDGVVTEFGPYSIRAKQLGGGWVVFVSRNEREPGATVMVFIGNDGKTSAVVGSQ